MFARNRLLARFASAASLQRPVRLPPQLLGPLDLGHEAPGPLVDEALQLRVPGAQAPHPEGVAGPDGEQEDGDGRPTRNPSRWWRPGLRRKAKRAPVSFQTPSLLQATTRKTKSPGGRDV